MYRGTLPNGEQIAIKRAQQGSLQGGLEFKTEIELLSRVHHKNVVRLLGFCFQQGEQMLIYDYVSNGSLKDNLSGTFLFSVSSAPPPNIFRFLLVLQLLTLYTWHFSVCNFHIVHYQP